MTTLEFSYSIFEFSKALKTFALKLTKDNEEADDLVQETYLKALFNKDKFATGTNLKAWLYTIMKNTFITQYQKWVRRKTFIDRTANLHYITSSSAIIHNKAYSDFTLKDINRALEKLEDIYRDPFTLYFNGFKYHEIASKLSIPIGTVKNRIHIARKELKENLSVYGWSN